MENAECNGEASASCQSLHLSLMRFFHTVITKSTAGDRTGKHAAIWCDSRLTLFMQIWKLCRARVNKATCCDALATTNAFGARGLKANASWSVTSPPLYCHSFPFVSREGAAPSLFHVGIKGRRICMLLSTGRTRERLHTPMDLHTEHQAKPKEMMGERKFWQQRDC